MKRASAELVLDAHADVGEGPVWDARSATLVWVDIMANELHRYNPTSGRDEITDVGQPVGCVALRRSGGVVLALRDGFAALDAFIPMVPAQNQVASCAFGGRELDDLYITTAANGLSAADIAVQPHAGGIFVFRAGVPGLPVHEFAG